ncbi:MAG TPA: uridine kinase [Candidatus Hydrogenedentes bacterium]|nr:uridine kinase [Candidatus Hydrogenedentota bacterium]
MASQEPYIIGIAGPSCSGKTLLAEHLAARLPGGRAPGTRTPIVSLDSYYRDLSHLEIAERTRQNFDAPEALDWPLLERDLAALARGQRVATPVYDFAAHTRASQTQRIVPGTFLIVEGLLALHDPAIRRFYKTSVFVDCSHPVCLARRIERDTRTRGRTRQSVLAQYEETVRPMADQYVLPTRQFADITVSGEPPVEASATIVLEHIARNSGTAP